MCFLVKVKLRDRTTAERWVHEVTAGAGATPAVRASERPLSVETSSPSRPRCDVTGLDQALLARDSARSVTTPALGVEHEEGFGRDSSTYRHHILDRHATYIVAAFLAGAAS